MNKLIRKELASIIDIKHIEINQSIFSNFRYLIRITYNQDIGNISLKTNNYNICLGNSFNSFLSEKENYIQIDLYAINHLEILEECLKDIKKHLCSAKLILNQIEKNPLK